MSNWPIDAFDLIYFPGWEEKINELSDLAEQEDWSYQNPINSTAHPILVNYIKYTYTRLAEEDKIVISSNGQSLAFNTGLVTPNQEAIFALCETNRNPDGSAWVFVGWRRKGEHVMTRFDHLPEMANYFTNPSLLVFDTRKEVRVNYEHIVSENKDRFPAPYSSMNNFAIQNVLKGALDSSLERIKRNYKTAIPQYYRGNIQLLLPLCLSDPSQADLALVASDSGSFYRISTCLTLDMAYNNARQLARPDRDWLVP